MRLQGPASRKAQSAAKCKVLQNPGLTSAAEKPTCQVTLGSTYIHTTRVSGYQLLRASRVKIAVALLEELNQSS
jgi:hypothetical protein